MRNRLFGYCGALLVLCNASALAKEEWQNTLETTIKADIQFTKLGNQGSLSTIGSKYTLTVENIHAMPTHGYLSNTNVIDNGTRKEANMGTRALTGILNASTRKTSGTQIEPQSKVGITRVGVMRDSVLVQIVTLKQEKITLKGDTQSQYLYTILQFPFRDLETMDPSEVGKTIFAALIPESGFSAITAPAMAVPSVRAGESAGKVPNNDLVGRTTAELIQLLGDNYQTVVVGETTVFVFPELRIRVPVINGKVVAAQ